MASPDRFVAHAAAQRRLSVMWLWGWLIPAVAVVVLYAPALNGQLVWDDGIVQMNQMVAFHTLHDVFFFPRDIPQWGLAYYRPLVILSYLADQALFGRNATSGPHAAVILYHLLTTFCVWLLARQILRRQRFAEWGALVAGVVFAVHPIHTESVCWITGRSDTVAAMFMIPALVTALVYRERRALWALLLSPALFLCAILSKEVALSAILVLPLLLILVPAPEVQPHAGSRTQPTEPGRTAAFLRARGHWLPLLGLYTAATGVYFSLRYLAHVDDTAARAPAWGEAIRRAGTALGYYLIKIVVPPPQSAFPTDLPAPIVTLSVLGVALGLFLASFWLWRRGAPLLLLCLGWVLLTLPLPLVAATRMIAKTPVAERSLYVPSVGMCLLAGGLFCAGWARRMWRVPTLVFTLALVGAYATWTYGRCQVWQDNVALWSDVTSHNPASGTPYHELGQAYSTIGRNDKAVECYEQALQRYTSAESRAMAWNSKGVALLESNAPEAVRAFQKAIEACQTYAWPYFNLGLMGVNKADREFAATKKYTTELLTSAQAYFTEAIKHNRRYLWAYLELGKCQSRLAVAFAQAGDTERAREALASARANFTIIGQLDPQGIDTSAAATRSAIQVAAAIESGLRQRVAQ